LAIPGGILGYRAGEVRAHIEMMERELSARVSIAEEEMNAALETQRELSARLSKERSELESYRLRNACYEKAMQKAEATAQCLVEAAEYRAEGIMAEGERYSEEQRLYIMGLDKQVSAIREDIREMALGVRRALERDSSSERVERSPKIAGHILETSGRNAPFSATTSGGFLEVDVSIQSVKALSQDGQEIGRVRSLVLDKAKDKVCGYEIEPQGQESPLKFAAIIPASAVIAVKRDALIVHNTWVDELKRAPVSEADTRVDSAQPRIASYTLDRIRAGMRSAGVSGAPTPITAKAAALSAAPAENTVDSQISSRRMQYLVGRISGTDIYDLEGGLIAGKGGIITPEIVEKSRSAGKLAELIVNMTIPGLSPDEKAASNS